MAVPVSIAIGEHILHSDPVVYWEAASLDAKPPSVTLTAWLHAGPKPPIFPIQGHGTSSIAFEMDAQVAKQLYERLGELGQSMGWLPQK